MQVEWDNIPRTHQLQVLNIIVLSLLFHWSKQPEYSNIKIHYNAILGVDGKLLMHSIKDWLDLGTSGSHL
jgi:hypothetical protein